MVIPFPPSKWSIWTSGITQSALGDFMTCRKSFQLKYMYGLSSGDITFPLIFGNAVHYVLEHAYRSGSPPTSKQLANLLDDYHDSEEVISGGSAFRQATERQKIELWLGMANVVCKRYFLKYHKDFTLDWKFTEREFCHPFKLSNGSRIMLNGKMDGCYINSKGEAWLKDHKTKSRYDESDIADQLLVDLQMMLYLSILWEMGYKPKGCRYNIIRRPELYYRKEEDLKSFLQRLDADILKRPKWYFYRLDMTVTKSAIDRWKTNTLEPIILDLIRAIDEDRFYANPATLKWGGLRSEFFAAITNNDYSRLFQRKKLFPELEGVAHGKKAITAKRKKRTK